MELGINKGWFRLGLRFGVMLRLGVEIGLEGRINGRVIRRGVEGESCAILFGFRCRFGLRLGLRLRSDK